MNIPYFRGRYNPDIDDTQNSGGLLALLQAAMQRGPSPGVDPAAASNGVGNYSFPQAGTLTRPVSFQADRDLDQTAGADNPPTQLPSAGADFRQVSRARRGTLNTSSQANAGLGLSFSQDRGGAPDSLDLRAPSSSPGNDTQASKGNATSPNVKMAQVVLPGDGLPFPPTPGGLGGSRSLPQIPAPPIPDSLRALWAISQLQRRAMSGGFGGRGGSGRRSGRNDDDDDDLCTKRRWNEEARCDERDFDYAHRDFKSACKARAVQRWDKCNRNGGRPDPSEPPEWGPDDEDIWFDVGR